MSSLETLARPYAKAAFELAHQQGALAEWSEALSAASHAVGDDTLSTWLGSPDVDRAKAVDIVSATAGGGEPFARFLAVLADNDRLTLLPQVSARFGKLRQRAENRLDVRVVSAVALDDDQASRLSAALAKRFDCDISLSNEVDASVLGGAVIYAGDQVIDGSLKGRLENLESSLA